MKFEDMLKSNGLKIKENDYYELLHLTDGYGTHYVIDDFGMVNFEYYDCCCDKEFVISIYEFMTIAKWLEENGITWDNVEEQMKVLINLRNIRRG